MDTSKEYIEMCSKATEIQDLRPIKGCFMLGDFIYLHNKYSTDNGVIGGSGDGRISVSSDKNTTRTLNPPQDFDDMGFGEIWLPRQDQLQKMISDDIKKICDILTSTINPNGIIRVNTDNIPPDRLEKFKMEWLDLQRSGSEKIPIVNSEVDWEYHTVISFSSMEQIWLSIVMKERYNKVWSDEKKEWEKIEQK